MITYPNQKKVLVEEDKNNMHEDVYNNLRKTTICAASRLLNGAAFKIYLYMCMNKNGYEFALSSEDVTNVMGISGSSYKRGIKELIEKGWLIFIGGNRYKVIKNKYIKK